MLIARLSCHNKQSLSIEELIKIVDTIYNDIKISLKYMGVGYGKNNRLFYILQRIENS